jgi:hypothetical protein
MQNENKYTVFPNYIIFVLIKGGRGVVEDNLLVFICFSNAMHNGSVFYAYFWKV